MMRLTFDYLLSPILRVLSFLVPRKRRLWVFAGWHKNTEREIFADNCKYLFLHVANERKDIRAVWLARDAKLRDILRSRGYESHCISSFYGAYCALRAGYTFIDALMHQALWRYSGGSRVVQLWHGDGIKKLDLAHGWFRLPLGAYSRAYRYISSSRFFAHHFIGPSFGIKEDSILITGLPRYDAFFNEIAGADIDIHEELRLKLDFARTQGSRAILYAPTFRRTATVPLAELRLKELDESLRARNDMLFVSLHPKFATQMWKPQEMYTNITFINPDFDRYPLLPRFDLLITDYSSICVEFLLLDKPTIFYIHDLDAYKKETGTVDKIWSVFPGSRVSTFEALLDALNQEEFDASLRTAAREKLFEFTPGTSSKQLVVQLLK